MRRVFDGMRIMNSELSSINTRLRSGWLAIGALSGMSNVLALTGSVFMLSVFDRVIPSGSIPTLVALSVLCLSAYGVLAGVDIVRSGMLARIGLAMKEALAPRAFDIGTRRPEGEAAAKDLNQIQGFFGTAAPSALFDLPWVPVYLGVCFLLHPWLGILATSSAVGLGLLALTSDLITRGPSGELTEVEGERAKLLAVSRRHAETVQALGMRSRLAASWNEMTMKSVSSGKLLADTIGITGAISRTSRMAVQSAVLALGAYLVVLGEATGGVMIAASILAARALAPIDATIAHARAIVGFRQSWKRLKSSLAENPPQAASFSRPPPSQRLTCENVSVRAGSGSRFLLRDISFSLQGGDCLAILGGSGAGKSTLCRTILGLVPTIAGDIRLDGAAIDQWTDEARGVFIGYLSQQPALFEGTVAQNIARFDPNARPDTVISAAAAAGAHDMISQLDNGYSTTVGADAAGLSIGQVQRICLARALYGNPFLVVLDEPDANVDAAGREALADTIMRLRERGAVTLLATHRSSTLSAASHALVLAAGRLRRFGPVREVLATPAGATVGRTEHAA